jgi:hypothetical protein
MASTDVRIETSLDLQAVRRELDRLAFARLAGLSAREEEMYQRLSLREAELVHHLQPNGRWFSRAGSAAPAEARSDHALTRRQVTR